MTEEELWNPQSLAKWLGIPLATLYGLNSNGRARAASGSASTSAIGAPTSMPGSMPRKLGRVAALLDPNEKGRPERELRTAHKLIAVNDNNSLDAQSRMSVEVAAMSESDARRITGRIRTVGGMVAESVEKLLGLIREAERGKRTSPSGVGRGPTTSRRSSAGCSRSWTVAFAASSSANSPGRACRREQLHRSLRRRLRQSPAIWHLCQMTHLSRI